MRRRARAGPASPRPERSGVIVVAFGDVLVWRAEARGEALETGGRRMLAGIISPEHFYRAMSGI